MHTAVGRSQAPWSKSTILNSFPFPCSHLSHRGFGELSLGPSGFLLGYRLRHLPVGEVT